MLLQSRGRMTARALAAALEVSERTVYRDVDALCAAGVPVTTESGPGGGVALLDSYRTTLTGLTDDEARALFMLSVPAPLAGLGAGVSERLQAALLKLAASLPDGRRGDPGRARQRIHLDSAWWFQSDEPAPCLETLYQAVWQDRRVRLTRALRYGPLTDARVEQTVDPYGLVAKANVWHLVCAQEGRLQAYRVSHILDARLLDERFTRPPDFDLASFWAAWCAEFERGLAGYAVTARSSPQAAPMLDLYLGERAAGALAGPAPRDAEGWLMARLVFESLEEARGRLLAMGGAVEVLEPEALRRSMADFGARIAERYAGG